MTSELIKEIKENPKIWLACFGGMAFVTLMMVGLWIDVDPSRCNYSDSNEQRVCKQSGWLVRSGEIALPIMITVMVIRIFRDDPNETSEQPKSSQPVGFDYSKMGAKPDDELGGM